MQVTDAMQVTGAMQVTETKSEGLERAYRAKASAAQIAAEVERKLEAVRPTAQLKGFRKGKAPQAVLKRMFGKSVLGEVMQEFVDGAVKRHLEENAHRPAQQPTIKLVNERFDEGDDLEIEFAYELLPDVPDVAFGEIALERLVVRVADDKVDLALANLAKSAQSFVDKDGAADTGDQVTIDFTGRIDGVAFDGGAAESFPLTLGSGQFIPGFEEQLVGAVAGEARDVSVSFPEGYAAAQLAGRAAVFEVRVGAVKAPVLPPIDDALAERFGASDLAELTDRIRGRFGEEFRRAARSLTKRALLDALHERVSFALPESMVALEARQIAHQLWHDANPQVQGHDHPPIEPTAEHRAIAERRVRLGLLLADVGTKQGLTVSEQELANVIMAEARRYPGQEKAFFEFAQKSPEVRQQLSAPIFEDKVVDYILELAKVSEREVDAETLEAALKAQEVADDAAAPSIGEAAAQD